MSVTPNDPLDIAVGGRIRLIRLLRGLSQDALARDIGVTFQQIQKYEAGRNRISASMLARVAQVLETPIGAFFGEGSPSSQAVDEATELLGTPGALDLLRAYGSLQPGAARRNLVELLESLQPDRV